MRDAGRDRAKARGLGARQHDVGRRGRREIDFLERAPKQRVAHGAADDAGFIAVLIDGVEHAPERRAADKSRERGFLIHWMRPGTIWPFST